MKLINLKDQWLRGNILTSNLILPTSSRVYPPKINRWKKKLHYLQEIWKLWNLARMNTATIIPFCFFSSRLCKDKHRTEIIAIQAPLFDF
jgi:hypothetical protein